MPRLAWVTDLHLNFLSEERADAFASTLAGCGADALLVGGDTSEAYALEHHLALLAKRFDGPVWFVLGNHDFYRSSIERVRRSVPALTARIPGLRWLEAAGVVPLSAETALVGCDGFGDARAGDFAGSTIVLNDFLLVEELAAIAHVERQARLRALGDRAAAHLRAVLPAALASHRRVVVLTHVPPFVEACRHQGKTSDPAWLPYFTCVAAGDALREAAAAHPDRELRVLCGHTHAAGEAQILPNLRVVTGAAEYGAPRLAGLLELG